MLWLSRSIRESKKVSLNSVILSHMRSVAMAFIIAHRYHFFGGSCHDKLPEVAHRKAPAKSLRIKDQSCPVLRWSHNTVR